MFLIPAEKLINSVSDFFLSCHLHDSVVHGVERCLSRSPLTGTISTACLSSLEFTHTVIWSACFFNLGCYDHVCSQQTKGR